MCSVSVVSRGRKFYVTSSLENVETRDISTAVMTGFLWSFYFFVTFLVFLNSFLIHLRFSVLHIC